GVSAEEIPAVLLIARRSSVSPNQVIADRKGGKQFAAIAEANHIKPAVAGDFVSEANIIFLSEYHGQPAEQIRAQHTKGASFVQINQQYRRTGMKPKTEKGVSPNK
ncbi:MAG: hypothetical protein H7Y20_16510, partial [Bryobacteraceae bacterium]|nr:hypothetical protein [Bryobacteraceae bacterium]